MKPEQIEELLARREASSQTASAQPDGEAERLVAALDALGRTPPAVSTRHFALSELRQHAADRRAAGAAWTMPDHLSACPLCLDLYAALLEEARAPAAPQGTRVLSIRSITRIAAAAALAIGLVAALRTGLSGRVPPRVERGELVSSDGRPLAPGAAAARGQRWIAKEPSAVRLGDGSLVEAAAGTALSVERTLTGSTVVNLTDGEITLSVARQAAGRPFSVRTELGEITVVGTRFSVRFGQERLRVYEADGSQVRARDDRARVVQVAVSEGSVRVRNRHRHEVLLAPGQTATLRDQEPEIVVGGRP